MWRNYMNLRQKKIILVISFSILMIALMIVRYTSVSDILYVFLAIAAFVWLALFVFWWRCPHCGRGLGRLHFGTSYCPYCGNELYDD